MTSNILHRQNKTPLPVIQSGEGVYLTDSTGKRYLEGSGGAAVSCLGYGNEKVIRAIKDQLDSVAFAHTGFFTNKPAEELAEWLCKRAPGDFGRVVFAAGGTEAVEAALKIARQVHVERGDINRSHYIGRRQSYHGATLATSSIGYHVERRKTYAPMLLTDCISHISPAYAYRNQGADESGEDYGKRAAQELEDEILRVGPDKVSAFVAETVVGATIGVVPPPPGYFWEIRRICDQYGVLLILDEVMCGMGRTGTLFACEQDGVEPDLITFAKGLGAGYQPIGATMVSSKNAEAIINGSGLLQHGHTYMAHATACAGALAVQQVIEEENLLANCQTRGKQLMSLLQERLGQHAHVGDIRGRGLFIGLEFVADRETKETFAPELNVAGRLKAATFENGLICYPSGGTADGTRGDHVLLAPPFIISEAQLDELVEKLDKSLTQVLDAVN
jgi:adenosylmethionine-8-amino-7-oxononanoate aminotransferase